MINTPPPDALMRASRAEYARRMNRVLDYIDQHLDAPLDLAQLADVANFSRFHFHRVFAAWMGETLGDYARRRRLETAAARLARGSGEPVLDIALASGFGSGEAFARAFKLQFGCTPTAWRAEAPARAAAQLAAMRSGGAAHSNPDQVHSKRDQARPRAPGDHDGSLTLFGEVEMEVHITDLPAVRVAYQRKIGPYGPQIGAFWRDAMAPWMQSHALDGQPCFGVGHDDPSITAPDKCRYDACVAVPDDFQPGALASIATLPGGRYAVARFRGQPLAIANAWTWLTREWLPSSGMQCDDRPCFERFQVATCMDPATGEFSGDICIPVRAL
ncbi:AraC family transcriptional regulator [Pseudoduganella sp. LjRoot289]|uniref:AraC family transcriptional regulator n=1 Tax=Pseudoduganella sp. LjRoot289 TaxID=3342314 RepID=UPI003ECC4D4A